MVDRFVGVPRDARTPRSSRSIVGWSVRRSRRAGTPSTGPVRRRSVRLAFPGAQGAQGDAGDHFGEARLPRPGRLTNRQPSGWLTSSDGAAASSAIGAGAGAAASVVTIGTATMAAGAATSTARGSTTQNVAPEVARREQPIRELGAGRAMVLEEADQLVDAPRAVLALAHHARQAGRGDALAVERRHVAAGRVVEVGPAAGHPGAEVRADRSEDDDGPAGHVLAAVRPDALDDGLGARVADREAHPGPPDEVQPARRWRRTGTVLPAIASPAAATARSGSGTIVTRPPDRPLPT